MAFRDTTDQDSLPNFYNVTHVEIIVFVARTLVQIDKRIDDRDGAIELGVGADLLALGSEPSSGRSASPGAMAIDGIFGH